MKRTFTLISKKNLVACLTLLVLQYTAQKGNYTVGDLPSSEYQTNKSSYDNLKLKPEEVLHDNSSGEVKLKKTAALANCTDMVDFVGGTAYYVDKVGGPQQNSSQFKARGLYMIYPKINNVTYKGSILGVVFNAATYLSQTTANMEVTVTDINVAGTFASGAFLGSTNVQVIGTTATDYTVYFSNPIPITSNNGFAIGIEAFSSSDSCKIFEGPNMGGGPAYGNVLTWPNFLYTYSGANRINVYPLLRPIITTSVNPTWASAKTSTACGAPAVYNFTNTTVGITPNYQVHSMISPVIPNGKSLDYGNGIPAINFPNGSIKTNTYTNLGSFNAVYAETYYGWVGDCTQSLTANIIVDNPLPSFNYTTNGLVVTLNNTSGGSFSNYVWNFGDLSTSPLTQPGTHTFSIPGTYVIELEATAPCGKVRYSVTVTVPSNTSNTGLAEKTNNGVKISVVPSPANSFIKIENKGVENLESKIEIYNTLGAVIKTVSNLDFNANSSVNVEVSDLPNGVYFIKFKSKNSDLVKSFIKE